MSEFLPAIYIMTNRHNTILYTGVTSDLIKRVYQHKNKFIKSFSQKYNCNKLVYYEVHLDMYCAISREKQIKAGPRKKKIELIEKTNPKWEDLYDSICL